MAALHSHARAHAFHGFMITLVSLPFACLSFHLGYYALSFIWLPTVFIYLWPRQADVADTVIYMFILGLCLDFMSGGPIGVWALIFLISNFIFPHDLRDYSPHMKGLWGGYGGGLIVNASLYVSLLSIFSQKITIPFMIIPQLALALLLFPFIFLLRKRVRAWIQRYDDAAT